MEDVPTQPFTQSQPQNIQPNGNLGENDTILICSLICTTNNLPEISSKSPGSHGSSETPSETRHQMIELRTRRNTDTTASSKWEKDEWWFGRNRKCDFILSSTARLSNKHFRIWLAKDGSGNALIQDSSTNGTFVNNSHLQKLQNYILCQGDEIAVGVGVKQDEIRFIIVFPKNEEISSVTSSFASTTLSSNKNLHEGIHAIYDIRGEVVGQGAFATVKKAIERSTGITYAVKIISKRKVVNIGGISRELSILRRISHENVVQLKGFYEDLQYYYLVMDYVPGGDLMDFVTENGAIGEDAAKDIAKQILEAVEYCHGIGISHRDLKPDNILIANDSPVKIKITDFGLAKISDAATVMKTFCGTLAYVAPEVISGKKGFHSSKPKTASTYSSLVDMWSLGCLVYVILTANYPFAGNTQEQLFKQIIAGLYPVQPLLDAGVSEEGQQFVESLLQVNPNDRPTASEALKSHWLRDLETQPEDPSQPQQMDIDDEGFKVPIPKKLPQNNDEEEDQPHSNEIVEDSAQHQNNISDCSDVDNEEVVKAAELTCSQRQQSQLGKEPEQLIENENSVIEHGEISNKSETAEMIEVPNAIISQNSRSVVGVGLRDLDDLDSNDTPPGTWATLTTLSKSIPWRTIYIGRGVHNFDEPFFLGRHPDCDEKISDPRISKCHCNLMLHSANSDDARIWLLDYSMNGCSVNNQTIGKGKKCLLEEGDLINIFFDPAKSEFMGFKLNTFPPCSNLSLTPRSRQLLIVTQTLEELKMRDLLLLEKTGPTPNTKRSFSLLKHNYDDPPTKEKSSSINKRRRVQRSTGATSPL